MPNKIVFFVVATLVAFVLPPIVGAAAAVIGSLAGMNGAALIVLFGSAAAATFGAVLALAGLAADLFFNGPNAPPPTNSQANISHHTP